jgi:hypothetical protein
LYRTEYEGAMLRQNLGVPFPNPKCPSQNLLNPVNRL